MAKRKRESRQHRRQTKDRVLQARIPAQLDEELRNRAGLLGLSVSTVVRNVLLNTFDLVEGVVTDSVHIAQVLQGRAAGDASQLDTAHATAAEPPVVGWQDLTLNVNAICEQCNAVLTKGTRAAVGLPITSRPTFICTACVALTAERPSGTAGGEEAKHENPDSGEKKTSTRKRASK